MENQQQPPKPPKRARSDSSSSASDSFQPPNENQTADSLHPQKLIDQVDVPESSNNNSSHVEASQEQESPEKDSSLRNSPQLASNHTSLESTNQHSEASHGDSIDQSNSVPSDAPLVVYPNGDWQAVYDPGTNAYYFANSKTGETTWTNPLVPSEPTPSRPLQEAQDLGGIDPELARLDPHFSRIIHGHASSSDPRFTARFNAKTGRFEADPTHDPSRVSEFARARTQAEAFFDVAGWEKSLEIHNGRIAGTSKETSAAAIEKGKKLSKAQLEQFKKQKMEKKARNQRAWLIGSK